MATCVCISSPCPLARNWRGAGVFFKCQFGVRLGQFRGGTADLERPRHPWHIIGAALRTGSPE